MAVATIPAQPKLVVFGSPNSLLEREEKGTIWEAIFEARGEKRAYDALRRGFKRGQLTPLQWAEASGEHLIKAGITREVYEKATSARGLVPSAEEFARSIADNGGSLAIVSGGFSELCTRAAASLCIGQVIAQAIPVFGSDGKLVHLPTLNCDYEGKVKFTRALVESMGFGLDECILIAEGEGDIRLAHAMPSIAFNAPRMVERACDIAVRSKDLTELLNLFAVEAATKKSQKQNVANVRVVPHAVLLGNQKSDAVLIDFEGEPAKYEGLLDKFAAIGPLMTDKPGVYLLMRNIAGTGIKQIYVIGKPSVFRPDASLKEAAGRVPGLRIRGLEEGIEIAERSAASEFVHAVPEARKVFQAPFVPDTFSFAVHEFSGLVLAEVYRDRVKMDAVTGSSRAVLESIVARHGNRISASNVAWLAQQLLTKAENYISTANAMEFDKLQDAYVPVIMRTWLNGRKYVDERGEEATELNPLAVRIKNVAESTIPKSDALDESQVQSYVRQFLGEESAEQFDYSVWQRIEGQIADVTEMIRRHPETRRAHLLIARESDVGKASEGVEQPCHFALDLAVREGKLDMYAYLRSNDVVRAFPADAFAAMQLQMKLAENLNLQPGTYTHITTRAQIYSRDYHLIGEITSKSF